MSLKMALTDHWMKSFVERVTVLNVRLKSLKFIRLIEKKCKALSMEFTSIVSIYRDRYSTFFRFIESILHISVAIMELLNENTFDKEVARIIAIKQLFYKYNQISDSLWAN